MATKEQALKSLAAKHAKTVQAYAKAQEWTVARDAALAAAQALGATYADMEAATGLSTARITQLLRRTR